MSEGGVETNFVEEGESSSFETSVFGCCADPQLGFAGVNGCNSAAMSKAEGGVGSKSVWSPNWMHLGVCFASCCCCHFWPCIYTCESRRRLRRIKGLGQNTIQDCLIGCFCSCCSTAQLARELLYHTKPMEGEKPKYISEGAGGGGGAGGSGSGASVPFINNVSTGFPQVQVSRMSLVVDLGLGENAFGLVDPLN